MRISAFAESLVLGYNLQFQCNLANIGIVHSYMNEVDRKSESEFDVAVGLTTCATRCR